MKRRTLFGMVKAMLAAPFAGLKADKPAFTSAHVRQFADWARLNQLKSDGGYFLIPGDYYLSGNSYRIRNIF